MSDEDVFKNILGEGEGDQSFLGKVKRHMTKGNVANAISFVIMVVGLVLVAVFPKCAHSSLSHAFSLSCRHVPEHDRTSPAYTRISHTHSHTKTCTHTHTHTHTQHIHTHTKH